MSSLMSDENSANTKICLETECSLHDQAFAQDEKTDMNDELPIANAVTHSVGPFNVFISKNERKSARSGAMVHPIDVIDCVFPNSQKALARRCKSSKMFRARQFDPNLTVWPLTKGVIASAFRACYQLGSITCPDDPLNEEMRTKSAYFGYNPAYLPTGATVLPNDIPAEASGLKAGEWMIRLLLIMCKVCLSELEGFSEEELVKFGEQAVREGLVMAEQKSALGRPARLLFVREPYKIGGKDGLNLKLSEKTSTTENTICKDMNRKWFENNEDPYKSYAFGIPEPQWLDLLPRAACPSCGKNGHLYCAYCTSLCIPTEESVLKAVSELVEKDSCLDKDTISGKATCALEALRELASTPVVLPATIKLVHHPQEKITKSTGIHACIVAPNQCELLTFPKDLPQEGFDEKDTVVLFPTADSYYLDDPELDVSTIKNVVVVEATWQKAGSVLKHPSIARLRKIRLKERVTTFWRHQELGNQFLSTLEAIYYLCVELYERQRRDGIPTSVKPLLDPSEHEEPTSLVPEFLPLNRRRRVKFHPTNEMQGASPYHAQVLWKAEDGGINLHEEFSEVPMATSEARVLRRRLRKQAFLNSPQTTESKGSKGQISVSTTDEAEVGEYEDRVADKRIRTSSCEQKNDTSNLYAGEFDDLVFLYAQRYTKISSSYKQGDVKSRANHKETAGEKSQSQSQSKDDECEAGTSRSESIPAVMQDLRGVPRVWRTHKAEVLEEIVHAHDKIEELIRVRHDG